MRVGGFLALVAVIATSGCAGGEDDTGFTGTFDVGVDSTGDTAAPVDSTVADTGVEEDTNVVVDSAVDSSKADTAVVDTGTDTGTIVIDTGVDTGIVDTGTVVVDTGVVDTGTVVVDTGCPITTVTSCGACERACSTSNASATACSSGLCSPTCNAGFVNCSNPSAPAADNGCECEGTACCAGACQTKHSNGLGQYYYDCGALGVPGTASTYSSTMANSARAAWTGSGTDSNGTCGVGSSQSQCVARTTSSSCAVWCYAGPLAGRVKLSTTASCGCPLATDATWQ